MSIKLKKLSEFKQVFDIPNNFKSQYGEVRTDFKLIKQMFDLLDKDIFKDLSLKWCDPCCGNGYFSIFLYYKLIKLLPKITINISLGQHILQNMLTLIEFNDYYKSQLKDIFGNKSKIFIQDFLQHEGKYDIIFGNPPFNLNGQIKVPTNKKMSKKKDGKTIWFDFVKHSIHCLNENGYLLLITPSIWMKNDHPAFDFITKFKILKLHTMTNTETNKIFHKQAQTPTSFFLVQKTKTNTSSLLIYENYLSKYTNFHLNQKSIPLLGISIVNKLKKYVDKYGCVKAIKTSIRPSYKSFKLNNNKSKEFPYPNISTCRLNKTVPELVIKWSNKELVYRGKKKLILAHKMYGFPFLDKNGTYGICNRDNYVIIDTLKNLNQLYKFLSTTFAMFLFETTRYRMKYLERYCFEFIPNICNIKDFPTNITNDELYNFFNLNDTERKMINSFYKKKYIFFTQKINH